MKFAVYQNSLAGARPVNEDRLGYCYTRQSSLFLLADGMGGHPEGAAAAQLALQTFSARFQQAALPLLRQVPSFLSAALLNAHHRIVRYAADKGMLDTPRTTVVAAVIERNQLHVVHCGDSRLYLVRKGRLLLRTRDHSMLERDRLAERAGASENNRNLLFSCLGSPVAPVFDANGPVLLERGDRLLLCSDGLWSAFGDEELVAALAQGALDRAVEALMALALQRGGARCDNVSALALEWETQDDFDATHVSTDDIGDGAFSSTLDAHALDGGDANAWDMDEAAIERTIAEINEAIRKTAARKT